MFSRITSPCLLAVAVLALSSSYAEEPFGQYYFEVAAVTASSETRHDVNLKDRFHAEAVETWFEGPKMLATRVMLGNPQQAKQPNAFQNWYAITEPRTAESRVLVVQDALEKHKPREVTIRRAAYLLLAAQQLTSGQPDPIPEDLGVYQAYELVDGPQVNQAVAVVGGQVSQPLVARQPVLLCVPTEKRHHDEYVPIKRGAGCLLVYRVEPQKLEKTITCLDAFGISTLKTSSVKWLVVPAKIIENKSRPGAD